ncbi:MAG: MarR family transcriptional regulator [Gemmatimonadetes bacterium]|nr:MarR family transcriptional regulator [Gemmatimonadota bacterium]
MPEPLIFLSPLHKATRQIGTYLSSRMVELELAGSEGHVLAYLGSYAPVPISELSSVFGHRKSTLTSLLDRLEERGLIRRDVHPGDRRSFVVSLTPRGRKLATRVRTVTEEFEARVRAGVTAKDLEGFRRVMDSIANVTQVELKPTRQEKSA